MTETPDLKKQKTELRKEAKFERQQLDFVIKHKYDKEICQRFLKLEEYIAADVILTYISVKNEVGTDGIIKQAFADGKTVAVPVCEGDEMNFYIINASTELVKTDFGTLEPDASKCREIDDFSNALCIVPALLFDRGGYRLGYGGGYYDKFFKKNSVKKAGLCYNLFIVDLLPRAHYDIPVDLIVTQNEIIDITQEGRQQLE